MLLKIIGKQAKGKFQSILFTHHGICTFIEQLLKELFDDDYVYSKHLRVKVRNESKFVVATEGELSGKGTLANITFSREGLPLSLDKLRIKSDGRILAEASLYTSPISKFTVSAEDGRQGNIKITTNNMI